jgi:hypothetical protein
LTKKYSEVIARELDEAISAGCIAAGIPPSALQNPQLKAALELIARKVWLFLESTFIDQINPKRQTAGPPEGGSPELDLASYRLSPKAEPDAETAPLLARWFVLPSTYHPAL